MYNEGTASQLLKKLHEKGWNAYARPPNEGANLWHHDMIKDHLAVSGLEVDKKYVLLPKVDEPNDPEKVIKRYGELVDKRGWSGSYIYVNGNSKRLIGFTLNPEDVKLNTLVDVRIGYEDFLIAIDDLVDVN